MCNILVFEWKIWTFLNTLTTDLRTTFLSLDFLLSSCVSFTIPRLKRLLVNLLGIYFLLKIIFILSISFTPYVLYMSVLLWNLSSKTRANSRVVFSSTGLFPIFLKQDLLYWGHFGLFTDCNMISMLQSLVLSPGHLLCSLSILWLEAKLGRIWTQASTSSLS